MPRHMPHSPPGPPHENIAKSLGEMGCLCQLGIPGWSAAIC